jgi:hypothetical protein
MTMVDYEIKFGKNFENETERKDEKRSKIHHFLRRESNQRENFVINLEDFILCEFWQEIFHSSFHDFRFSLQNLRMNENFQVFIGLLKTQSQANLSKCQSKVDKIRNRARAITIIVSNISNVRKTSTLPCLFD